MGLLLMGRLRNGRYDAAQIAPTEAEWPPHPARVFCALVASAAAGDDPNDWAALRWLEQAGTPEVWAATQAPLSSRTGFVVTNRTDQRGRSQQHPGRTNGVRTRAAAVPKDPEFAIVWPQAAPDAPTLSCLSRLARQVPYLGRSTSTVTLTVWKFRESARGFFTESGTQDRGSIAWHLLLSRRPGERLAACSADSCGLP